MVLDLDNPLLAASEMLCTSLNYIRTDYELSMTHSNISTVVEVMISYNEMYFFPPRACYD